MESTALVLVIFVFVAYAICVACFAGRRREANNRNKQQLPSNSATRLQILKMLRKFYLHNLVEDCIDGTCFDKDVLDAIKVLEEKYSKD